MIKVYSVSKHHSGFAYQASSDCAEYPEFDTVEEYLYHLRELSCEVIREDDTHDEDSEKVRAAVGNTHGEGNDVIIGVRDGDDMFGLELVVECE